MLIKKNLNLFFIIISFSFIYLYSSIRNPFIFNQKYELSKMHDAKVDKDILSVLAISKLKSNLGKYRFGAIIKKSGLSEIFFVGDSAWGYKVSDIYINKVILLKNDEVVVLKLNI